MSNKQDWKETDELLAKLRAKIQEDTSAPIEPVMPQLELDAAELIPAEEPTAEPVVEPVEEPAPEVEEMPTEPEPLPVVEKPARKDRRRKRVAGGEDEALAWVDRRPARETPEPPAVAVQEGTGAVAPTPPPAEPGAVPQGKKTPSRRAPARARRTPARPVTRTGGAERQASADDIASLTVESLMNDIFGAAKDEKGRSWFRDGKAIFDREEETEEPEKAAGAVGESAHGAPADPPATPEGGSPTEATGETGSRQERLAPNAPATVISEKDGQMAFVLPKTGKASEADPEALPEESGGFDGKHLFSAFSIRQGESSAPGAQVPREGAEKQALKESLESSEEDFQLLLDLDYEDELGNAIGFEKIREYRELGVNGAALKRRRRQRADERREFETQGQDIRLRKEYARQKKGHIIRLALSLALLLFIFLYEHPTWMPLLFRGPIDSLNFPRSYILIGIQLLVVDAALAYRRLCRGFLAFVRLTPTDHSLCAVTVALTFLYHLILIFLPVDGSPVLYLSPAAAAMSLLLLSDLLDWYREFNAFRVVSSRRQKYALISRVSVGGKQNNARERLTQSEQTERVWYVRPVGFVRNYFLNTERRVEHNRSLGVQLLLAVAVGLACGLYVRASGGSAGDLLLTVLVTLLLCLPAISMLVTSLPMFLASVLCLGRNGAIIGEEPVYSSGERTTLVLPDSEVFEAMDHEQFECVEDCDIQQTLILVRALLERIQSPLVGSVDVDAELRIPQEQVTLTEITEDGVAATIGKEGHRLLMGSIPYLRRSGIPVSPRGGAEGGELYRRMLLIAVDGRVSAIFLARYRFSDKMQQLLTQLRGEDVRLMVRSKDPGIHNELLETLLPDEREPIRVMKPTAAEVDIRTDRVDATIVALGSCREACRTLLVCRRIRRMGILGKLLQGLSMAVGALLAVLVSVFGRVSALTPALVTLYILFWCVIDGVTSYIYLREKERS